MNILVSAGPTREYIDSVRFISNASSGKTGFEIAKQAQKNGHEVTLIAGPVNLTPPKNVNYIPVTSAKEMQKNILAIFTSVDVLIMTAAVSDYRPDKRQKHKIKKSADTTTIRLLKNPDILAQLGKRKTRQILIGFALEDRAAKKNALQKFKTKNLDAIILNSPDAMEQQKSAVKIYTESQGWKNLPTLPKAILGKKIVKLAEKLWLENNE